VTAEPNGHHPAEVIDLDPRRYEPAPTPEDDEAEGPPVLVDSLEAQRPARPSPRTAQRRPILAAWLQSRAEFQEALAWALRHAAHVTAFHAIRVPTVYLGRLALRSPRGAWRVTRGTFRWVTDWEGHPVRTAALERTDDAAYLRLSRQRNTRVKVRSSAAAIAALPLLAITAVVWLGGPAIRVLGVVGLVAVLGALGRPEDKPLLDTAVVKPKAARLTSEMVRRALASLGIGAMSERTTEQITFPAPIQRDGPGWRAEVDLPHGVTAGEVIERRDKLASGLRRPIGCCWPEPAHDQHAGRLVLWVGDEDLAQARQPAWPLLRSGKVDLFRAFPYGTDPRGRTVPLDLSYSNMLIGAMPGAGKSFSLRVPLLAAALDPRAELWVFDLKGAGDQSPLEHVAHRYAAGQDDPEIEQAFLALRALRAECSRRAKILSGLPKSVCPENKVTPQLAARWGLGLHPLVMAIDECQELFTHPRFGGKEGGEAGELAEKVIKLGRALGIVLLLSTQRPDAASLPTGVRANVGIRFCLRVMDQAANDMVLPTSSYRNGVRATMFTKRDKGVGYLVGGENDAQIVRTFYVDNPAAERVALRARLAREAAGTLGGYATGQAPEQTARQAETLLEDALGVVTASEDRIANEDLRDRLAHARPEVYSDWSTDRLTAALRDAGVDPREAQVHRTGEGGERRNRRGIYRQSLVVALTRRGGGGGGW
jgi:DNA segregation ATPase FtsK/SpoIIIE, S-DNA-T family